MFFFLCFLFFLFIFHDKPLYFLMPDVYMSICVWTFVIVLSINSILSSILSINSMFAMMSLSMLICM